VSAEHDCSDRSCKGWKRTTEEPVQHVCETRPVDALDVHVGLLRIVQHGVWDGSEKIDVDGESPMWISKLTLVLEVGQLPRLTLEGPAIARDKQPEVPA